MIDRVEQLREWRRNLVCFGGGCTFGCCANSKALTELLVDIYSASDVPTTIGREVAPGKGCYMCDVVSKIPTQQRKKKMHVDEATKRETQLTRVQMEKAQSTTTERT